MSLPSSRSNARFPVLSAASCNGVGISSVLKLKAASCADTRLFLVPISRNLLLRCAIVRKKFRVFASDYYHCLFKRGDDETSLPYKHACKYLFPNSWSIWFSPFKLIYSLNCQFNVHIVIQINFHLFSVTLQYISEIPFFHEMAATRSGNALLRTISMSENHLQTP